MICRCGLLESIALVQGDLVRGPTSSAARPRQQYALSSRNEVTSQS
jgi:hypothetical protein